MADQATAPPGGDEEVIDAQVVDEPGTDEHPAPAAVPAARQDTSTAVTIREGSTAIIVAETAADKVKVATEIADTLAEVIKKQGLRTKVGRHKVVKPNGSEVWEDKYHVDVEGWQTLATFLDVATQVVWSRKVIDPQTGQPIRTEYDVERFVYAKVNGKRPSRNEIKSGNVEVEHVEKATVAGYDWEAKVVAVRNGVVVGEAESMCSRTEESWRESDDFALRSMAQTRATSRAIAAAARWIVTLAGFAGTPAEEMTEVQAREAAANAENGQAAAGPAYGRALKDADKQLILDCLARLLANAQAPDGDKDAALEVIAELKKVAGDYVPYIAAHAIYLAAQKLDALLKEEGGEDAAARADADRAHGDPEPQDLAPPGTVTGEGGAPDDDIPF